MRAFSPDVAASLPGPEWLRARRVAAAERVAGTGLPTDAEEVWRYSRIGELDLDAYSLPAPSVEVPTAVEPPSPPSGGRWGAVVTVRNGRVVDTQISPALAEAGVDVAELDALDEGESLLGAVAPAETDAFTELNTAFSTAMPVVRVPAGVVVSEPVLIEHLVDTDGLAAMPRTLVHLGEDSEATVVERHSSPDVDALSVPVVEIVVGQSARLRYLNLQELGPRMWQVAYQASTVERDARLQSSAIALGGSYARVRTDSRLTGRGASGELLAVYFADGDRMHDFRTMQDHVAPSTTSELLFKGAVADRSRSVYSGLIRVRKEAVGTNAFQTNRNLVLSEGAGAESVPNLEIETNDVRCSHASAVGPIDEEQRFYLESRGVPPEVAERLIVQGFFSDVVARLPVPGLVDPLRRAVDAALAGSVT